MTTFKSDFSEVDRELRRLQRLVGGKGKRTLDKALTVAYTDVKGNIHVITRSLKNSARKKSESAGPFWHGEIIVGGATARPSVNDPVVYAEYERRRGGDHDFMRNYKAYHLAFGLAVKEVMKP